jgi:hypothetical protein
MRRGFAHLNLICLNLRGGRKFLKIILDKLNSARYILHMKNTLKLIRAAIRRWIRENIIAEGRQDSRGFHYSTSESAEMPKENSEK